MHCKSCLDQIVKKCLIPPSINKRELHFLMILSAWEELLNVLSIVILRSRSWWLVCTAAAVSALRSRLLSWIVDCFWIVEMIISFVFIFCIHYHVILITSFACFVQIIVKIYSNAFNWIICDMHHQRTRRVLIFRCVQCYFINMTGWREWMSELGFHVPPPPRAYRDETSV